MKFFLLLLATLGVVIFIGQNRQLVPLILFNNQIALELPVAIWLLLAVIAGMLTSIALQLLNEIPRRASTYSPPYPSEKFPPPPPPRTPFTPRATAPLEQPEPSETQEEWDIEEPPVETTQLQDQLAKEKKPRGYGDYEAPQKPQKSNQSGSVYSHSYHDPQAQAQERGEEIGKADRVYDANYRLIKPPDRPKDLPEETETKNKDEDEDWV